MLLNLAWLLTVFSVRMTRRAPVKDPGRPTCSPRSMAWRFFYDLTFVVAFGGPADDTSSVDNEGDVVDVAIAPVLARLGGADDGVFDGAGVGGCVFVG